jgi:TolB-like protein
MPKPFTLHYLNHIILIPLLLIACLTSSGCTAKKEKYIPGSIRHELMSDNFEKTWWNYYERALIFAEEKSYRKAEQNLHKAIEKNDLDQWRAEVNGKNVIDYFPHRELGITYFHRQEYRMAIAELEYSIESSPSAKAYFYLNRIRGAMVTGEGQGNTPPRIVFEASTAKELTNSFTKSIKGVVSDDNYVASIHVNDTLIPMDLAKKSLVFATKIPLSEGDNTIMTTATDLSGNTTERQLLISCDRRGPLVEIMETDISDNQVNIKGSVSDRKGLASLKINDRKWPITGASEGYNFKFAQLLGPITITARDRAGNMTRVTLSKNELMRDISSHTENTEGQTPLPLSDIPTPPDTAPPHITLEGIVNGQETFHDSILFNVRISDSSDIHSIFVNTEPILLRKGKKVFFSLQKKLSEGDNKFHFIAFDQHGNKTDKRTTIIRKIRKVDQIQSRMSIALQPFVYKGSMESSSLEVMDKLYSSLAELKRFKLTDSIKSTSPVQSTIPVNAVLSGAVTSSAEHVEIVARLADAKTSEILATHDVFGKITHERDIDILLKKLARKFSDSFPVSMGMITDIKGKEIIINLGTTSKIKPYTWFIFYRDSPPFSHPATGILIEPDPEILGMLQVQEVFEDSSRTHLAKGRSAPQKFDRVIAR